MCVREERRVIVVLLCSPAAGEGSTAPCHAGQPASARPASHAHRSRCTYARTHTNTRRMRAFTPYPSLANLDAERVGPQHTPIRSLVSVEGRSCSLCTIGVACPARSGLSLGGGGVRSRLTRALLGRCVHPAPYCSPPCPCSSPYDMPLNPSTSCFPPPPPFGLRALQVSMHSSRVCLATPTAAGERWPAPSRSRRHLLCRAASAHPSHGLGRCQVSSAAHRGRYACPTPTLSWLASVGKPTMLRGACAR